MEQQISRHAESGAVVVAAIIGRSKILLIKEVTKPIPHYWKLVSETVEPSEPILNALWRGLGEEAGFVLDVERDGDGIITDFIDDRISLHKLLEPHEVQGWLPHTRHFYAAITSDELILSLSGKTLHGDKNEIIETHAFGISELEGMADFLPAHRALIQSIRKS